MKKVTRYFSKARFTFLLGAFFAGGFALLMNPWTGKELPVTEQYTVVINGEAAGSAGSYEAAMKELRSAKLQLAEEQENILYVNAECRIEKETVLEEELQETKNLEAGIYQLLKNSVIEQKQKAYTVKVNDMTLTLSSREEVIALLEAAKEKYDANHSFYVNLKLDDSQGIAMLTTDFIKVERSENQDTTVMASEEGNSEQESQEESSAALAVSMGFEEDIEIAESYVAEDAVMKLEDAIAAITKEKETNKTYEVVAGDCLSSIALKNGMSKEELFALNEGLTENSILQIGDIITIQVPEPELSVIQTEEISYEEEYYAPVQYVDNDAWYTTREEVRSEGTVGQRAVTAAVTYRNGVEIGRTYTSEVILTESQPKIVEKGTQTPPTYIKPITVGSFSSPFGTRWGRMHEGVDWSCPVGSAIKASCGGKVVSAGWMNGYGNCIVLSHPDGKQTRYAHLSSILVEVGQTVSQGDKIALSGNTGNSTGPHLHFEILIGGEPVDPLEYLE